MAERRMFAKTIIDSDAFLDMPLSTQALYFHLSMRADDEGFVNNPKKIQRVIGCSLDDLKLLVAKNFIIPFESGVVVIKHWKIHNYIQSDRFKETVYREERSKLKVKDNKAYTLESEPCIQDVSKVETQVSIDKVSIDKDNILDTNVSNCQTPSSKDVRLVVEMWNSLESFGIRPVSKMTSSSKRSSNLRARLREYSLEDFETAIENIKHSDFLLGKHSGRPWQITFDWFVLPSNFPKVLEGNYISDNYLERKAQKTTQAEETQTPEMSDEEWIAMMEGTNDV